ncbi:hypothetical protein OS493_010696 [Desmophyllum pertusum]|uniref:Uncharacterized protein n=1 Tax=Desmophyllum pertusum TaxID=174260 RepID=A0A9W9ZRR2_9CNID|nr:hypothetical protein OS493_010696 [Desmophyllum pertusum]
MATPKMSGQGAETPNRGEATLDPELVNRDRDKRTRTLSRKALENAVDKKRRETNAIHKMLKEVMRSAEEPNEGSDFDQALRNLVSVSEKFKIKIEEFRSLTQDIHSYFGDEEVCLTVESLTLDRAYKLIVGIKNRQADKLLETSSRQSRHSHRSKSSTSTTSSAARVKAFAEAAVACESAEFERIIAEKEHERKQREAEIERCCKEERAQHEKNLAILAADKKVAVANAKQAMVDEEIGEKKDLPGIPIVKSEWRTLDWVETQTTSVPEIPRSKIDFTQQNTPLRASEDPPTIPRVNIPPTNSRATINQREDNGENTQRAFTQSFVASTPINISGSQLIESLTSENENNTTPAHY